MTEPSRQEEGLDQLLEALYENVAAASEFGRPTSESFLVASEAYRLHYGTHLPSDRKARIIDVGCGMGHFLSFLKEEGYRNVEGIDIGRAQVEASRQFTHNVYRADVMDYLEDKAERYRCVVMNDILEHMPSHRVYHVLRTIHRALEPGGVFIAKVPNISNPLNSRLFVSNMTHLLGFNYEGLFLLLYAVGFRDIEVVGIEGKRTLAGKLAKTLLLKLHSLACRVFWIEPDRVLDATLLGVGHKPEGAENTAD